MDTETWHILNLRFFKSVFFLILNMYLWNFNDITQNAKEAWMCQISTSLDKF